MKVEIIPTKPEHEILLELFPPVLANKMLPEWYKKAKVGNLADTLMNQDRAWEGTKGAKDCPAIQDYLSTGFVIPLWGTFLFKTFKNDKGLTEQHWNFTTDEALGSNFVFHHNQTQLGEMPLKTTMYGQTLKFQLPYKIIVPEGYNVLYNDPFYHFRKSLKCLSGVVEADKWGFVSFPFDLIEDNFLLEAGSPLVHCFIYKRETEKINLEIRNGTDDEYKSIVKQTTLLEIQRGNYKNSKP